MMPVTTLAVRGSMWTLWQTLLTKPILLSW